MEAGRYTKEEYKNYLRAFVESEHMVVVNEIVLIGEAPEVLRHSCPQTGVIALPRLTCRAPQNTAYGYREIAYYICNYCGKLFMCY